jgi:hypothetical protein
LNGGIPTDTSRRNRSIGDIPVFALALAALLASTPQTAVAAPEEDKIVCKAIRDPDLGSNIRKRHKTCMRASDWKELNRLNEEAKRKIFQNPRGTPPPVRSGVGASQ